MKAVEEDGVSIALACRTFGVSESCYRYEARLSDENAEIADWLIRLTATYRTWGFGLCFLYLRNVKGFGWNHKRVYRIYRELELNLRIKPRKRLIREKPDTLAIPAAPNETWSMDFMADQLGDGRSFRTWAKKRGIALAYIQPGKPQQNAYVERYNRTVRQEWLGQHIFATIEEARDHATRWLWTYNNERPNMANGGLTPAQKLKNAA